MEALQVLVIPNKVLLVNERTKISYSEAYDDVFYNKLVENNYNAVVLGVKSKRDKSLKHSNEDFYRVGTLVKVSNRKLENNRYHYDIKALAKVEVLDFVGENEVTYQVLEDKDDLNRNDDEQIKKYIKETISEVGSEIKGAKPFIDYLNSLDNITDVMLATMPYLSLSYDEKQAFLELSSKRYQALRFIDILLEYKENVKFQLELTSKFNEDVNEQYRKQMLKRQLETIKKELGEDEPETEEVDYQAKIEESHMPDEIKKVAFKEYRKLQRQGPQSAEANVIKTYLDTLLDLPWGNPEVKDIDIENTRKILDGDHYGLEKVKERIIQHLTVLKLKQNKQGSILLLVGPPGTGKTSIGRSIAKALDREYVRVALGGVSDEAEIRGHRRTYIGSMPGKIINGMKKANTTNPVFILDEIDKLSQSAHGDPTSAMLEVLDPEQNSTFQDHYLEVEYDLSQVFFVATANNLSTIPGPLLDRMEIIELSSYTSEEKFEIAKRHLVGEVLGDHGLSSDQVEFDDDTIKTVINSYTVEAGVRNLKRQLEKIIRGIAGKIITKEEPLPIAVTAEMLPDILGHKINRYDSVGKINPPGVVTGMAWTAVGGDILFIEGALMRGSGMMNLTGQLGDVMQESAKIAYSLVRSRLVFNTKAINLKEFDLHIHVPSGAIKKDGPSAGVTMFTTMASLITGIPVDSQLAMTGEISLRGAVLPVGGIKEKVIAAHRSGIKRVLLPIDNQDDIKDIPPSVRDDLEITFAETIEDVLKYSLNIYLPRPGYQLMLEKQDIKFITNGDFKLEE